MECNTHRRITINKNTGQTNMGSERMWKVSFHFPHYFESVQQNMIIMLWCICIYIYIIILKEIEYATLTFPSTPECRHRFMDCSDGWFFAVFVTNVAIVMGDEMDDLGVALLRKPSYQKPNSHWSFVFPRTWTPPNTGSKPIRCLCWRNMLKLRRKKGQA